MMEPPGPFQGSREDVMEYIDVFYRGQRKEDVGGSFSVKLRTVRRLNAVPVMGGIEWAASNGRRIRGAACCVWKCV